MANLMSGGAGRWVVLLMLHVIAGVASAQAVPEARQILPFDDGWRFHLGDDPAAKLARFDDSGWRVLDVPHDWSIEGPLVPPPEGDGNNGFFRHGIGWYRKSFASPADETRKTVVEFDGVYMNSEVWLNGKLLGRRPNGFLTIRYDLTQFLKRDGTPNVIAVRVDDSAEPSTRWYSGSGIYRHVRLIVTDYTHFRLDGGVYVTTPQVSTEAATVEVNYVIDANFFTDAERVEWAKDVWRARPVTRQLMLRSSVLAHDGAVVASAESTIDVQSMRAGQRVTQRVAVPLPRLWSAETPELYRLRSTLELDGRRLDDVTTTFGIRELVFDADRGLLVNGKPTKLRGVCVHQDGGSFGNAVPVATWALRLERLREMGCNAIRPSHHPFAPEFYDLCDRMGFYVFDEAFDEWTRDWPYNFTEDPRGKAASGYHLYFRQWYDTDLRAMIRRDRNHPSVVLYSIGNEVPDQLDPDGYKLAKELVAICHEEDPTRPATAGCDQSHVSARNGFMDELDLMGYNYIDRQNGTETYAPERARFPKRLMLGTETGTAIHMWLGVRDHDYVIGEFIWTGIDYLGEAGSLPRRGSGAGFLDIAAGRKPSFFQRAAYWREDPVLKLSVSRPLPPAATTAASTSPTTSPATTIAGAGGPGVRRREPPQVLAWSGTDGEALNVRAASNCDEVELFLNGLSLGRKAISGDVYAGTWPVPFARGTLSAVGYRKGERVAADELVTPAAASRLRIDPVTTPMAGDVSFYEITVVDDRGLPVRDVAPEVTVRVEGAGRLIGVDASDMTYAGVFKTDARPATGGRLLATVRRTGPAGEVRVTATASGLEAASAATPTQSATTQPTTTPAR